MIQVLVCDLDESLIKTDCLFEQWVSLVKTHPLLFLKSFYWLFKGRVYFKSQIARYAPLDVESLLYRDSVVQLLREFKKSRQSQVILASASPQLWVNQVARHLGLFDHVLASDDQINLKGQEKLRAIQSKIGNQPFGYIGDSPSDLVIWRDAAEVIAVEPSVALSLKIEKLGKPTRYIHDQKPSLIYLWVKQMRVHQWAKNVLIFLPLIAAHQLNSLDSLVNGVLAFFGFSLCASFIYLINDVLDLSADRKHRSKRNRPFASGNLSLKWLGILLPSLLIGVLVCCVWLSSAFSLWLAFYFIINLFYSFQLKKVAILDIVLLSMMYSLRIFAGSAATSIQSSEWLMSFSTIFFFGLACVKRYSEIQRAQVGQAVAGRGYSLHDALPILIIGMSSSLLSVLIFMLYLNSPEVRALYVRPELLWSVNPILLFWITRVWLLTHRDQMNDDPVLFALKDRASWFCLLIISIIAGFAL